MSHKLAMVIFPILLSCQVVVAQLPPDASDCLKDQYVCSMSNSNGPAARGCAVAYDLSNKTAEDEFRYKQCKCEQEQIYNSW
jgi:hypothetical protein